MYAGENSMNGRSVTRIMILALAAASLPRCDASAVEEARYKVIQKSGTFELREYEPQIVAETVVEGGFEEAGDTGFKRLFGYISGDNVMKRPIPMTAPVNQEGEGNRWVISFVMPSEFTMENLPLPTDRSVALRRIPPRMVAAISYSGTWKRSGFEEQRGRLEELIRKRGLRPAGEYIYARYDPPFKPWFLRHNEVLVTVEPINKEMP
jgi:hypothetical protein